MLRHNNLRFLIFLFMLSGLLIACGRDNQREIWARVDGTPIYRDQVEAIYRTRQKAAPDDAKPELALSLKLRILNSLIDRFLLLDRASQLQIDVTDKEVDSRLAQIRSPDADFQKELGGQAQRPAELRRQIEENLTIEKLIQKEILSHVTVTAGEIAAFYNANKGYFEVPQAQYHLAQILVTPVPDPQISNLMHDDARNQLEAQRKINALYLQVHSGKDFAKVAEQYSEDTRTASGGGDMGFVPVSSFASDPAVLRALKPLKPGQITGIIRDRSGFHIFKLLGRVDAGQRALSDPDVQETIRKTLMNGKVELLKAAYIESLRNHARIVNYLARQILRDHGNFSQ